MVTILHISDLHFGSSDLKGELPAISRALLRAARAQAWTPDVCVFSGDLAFSGTAAEFELGRKWLCDLLATPWNSRLFIVPGNHDVNRSKANIVLLQAGKSEAAFAKSKPALMRNAEHLDGFRKLHQDLKSLLADRLLSDWTDVFGTYGSFTTESGPTIHLVGLNTSLLSCGDDDEGRLVQELETLH